MAYKAEIKTTFEPHRVIQPIYTGGSVAIDRTGTILVSCQDEDVLLTNLTSGDVLARIESDGDSVTSLSLTPDARHLAIASRTSTLRIYELTRPDDDATITPTLLRSLKPHPSPVVVSIVDSTGTLLATGGADGVVKVWDIRGGYTTHTFHGHSGLVSALKFFKSDRLAESKQSKSRRPKSTKHEDSHMDLDTASDASASLYLATAGEDAKVRIWDLNTRKSIVILDSHVSIIRSLDFDPFAELLLSAGRDKTVIIWDVRDWQPKSTTPVLEVVETAGFVDDGKYFFTGGERGRLRIWTLGGQEKTEDQEAGTETEAILDILQLPDSSSLLSVHADQMLILHSLEPLVNSSATKKINPLPISRRIYGTHDEIIDLAYIGKDSAYLALATNSEDIRLVSLQDSGEKDSTPFGTDVGLLKAHQDIIISIDTDWSGHWLATGAKDNTAKLWRLDPATRDFTCYSTFTGHAESISAVSLPSDRPPTDSKAYSFPLNHPPPFMFTGSQDKTIKKWEIPAINHGASSKAPRAMYTRKAHDKDINAIDIAPSSTGTMFATASQDRTTKIWDHETGESIGVLRGHKRGVWSVAFAPSGTPTITSSDGASSGTKGLILTGSGDKTVRIWSLNDYSCLRTFEGHTNSVLKVLWLPASQKQGHRARSVQVASAAGDGLVKIWNAQDDECAATLDNHTDRVWALVAKPQAPSQDTPMSEDNTDADADADIEPDSDPTLTVELVSGSADATITFWSDTTSATSLAAATKHTQRIEQDQALSNAIHAGQYRDAIVLALQLNHPKRLLELFRRIQSEAFEQGSLSGRVAVDVVLAELSRPQLFKLLCRCRDWNTSARSAHVAQSLLYALFRIWPKTAFVELEKAMRKRLQEEDDEKNAAGADDDVGQAKPVRKEALRDVLDGLAAYTEKHAARLDKMAEQRHVLAWTLQMMDDTAVVAVDA